MVGAIEMTSHEGECRFCGNIQPILAADQIDADTKISELCACGGYEKEKQWEAILKNIEQLLGDKAGERGFVEAYPEQIDLVKHIAHEAAESRIGRASLTVENTAVTIAMTAKGRVKISRQHVKQTTLEA